MGRGDGMGRGNPSTSSEVERSRQREGVTLLGRRDLTTLHAVGQSLAIAPVTKVAVFGSLLATQAGGSTPVVVVLSLGVTLCFAWTITQYARRYAGAGGLYEYLVRGVGRRVGLVASGMAMFNGLVASASIPLLVGLLWEPFWRTQFDIRAPWWTGSVAATLFVAGLMYLGIRVSLRAQLVLTALAAAPLIILAVALIADPAETHTLTVFDPRRHSEGNFFHALLLGLLLFGGFEASAALGEEEAAPHRSIPRAMLLTVVGAGAFYVLVFYGVVVGLGPGEVQAAWGRNPSALSVLADARFGAPFGAVVDLAIIVDLVVAMAAFGNSLARGLFALARDRLLPSPLAARSRFDTPLGGTAAFAASGLVGVVVGMQLDTPYNLFEAVALMNVVLVTPVLVLLAIGAVRLFSHPYRQLLTRLPVILVGGAVPVFALYGTLNPLPTGAARWGIVLVGFVLAMTLFWAVTVFSLRPVAAARAAAYALTPDDEGRSGRATGGDARRTTRRRTSARN